ncbi:hypothetical protein Daus18300_013929, partial [Diaporthe australafricana]
WQSPAAATGQGEWAEDANTAIQPFIQEAVSVTKAYCMVYKKHKQKAEELLESYDHVLKTLFLLAEAINNVLPETESIFKTTKEEEARAQQTASLLRVPYKINTMILWPQQDTATGSDSTTTPSPASDPAIQFETRASHLASV